MMRMMGTAAILLSAVAYLLTARVVRTKQEMLVQNLLSAVESIETAIRWEKRTLPDSIAQQVPREYAGGYFSHITERIKSGSTLQKAWISTFADIEPQEISRILCAVSFSGDSTFLQDQLAFTAAQIRKFQQKEQEEKQAKQKLRAALAFSAAGLAVILLL